MREKEREAGKEKWCKGREKGDRVKGEEGERVETDGREREEEEEV